MPYKIVQMIQRGKTVIVPSFWEENGSLWWPPNKTHYRLMKDEQSKPDLKEWRLMECAIKKNNIRTYQLAEAELLIMQENSDTGVEDCIVENTTLVENEEVMKFERISNNSESDQNNLENPSASCSNVSVTGTDNNPENIVPLINLETSTLDKILANQIVVSEKINNMLHLQTIFLDNQHKIVQKLATQSVQLDEISKQLAQIKEGPSNSLLKDRSYVDEGFQIKPIESQKDLITLEQLLTKGDEKTKLKKSLSFLCSSSIGDGKTCAYKLQDILFTRDFLCNCSWTGGSRGDMSKIPLKDYKNVLKFFHEMIQLWDPTYTVQDNEQFFKVITKNSRQRKSMKNLRMSTKRCHKNKDLWSKHKKGGIKRQLNNDKKETEGESMQIQ